MINIGITKKKNSYSNGRTFQKLFGKVLTMALLLILGENSVFALPTQPELIPQGIKPRVTFTPKVKWLFPSGSPIYASSVQDEVAVYFANIKGQVYALDKNLGQLLWTYQSGGPIFSNLTRSEDELYFQSDDGYAYKISAPNGQVKWKVLINSTPANRQFHFADNGWNYRSSSLILKDDMLFIGSANGKLFALDEQTGKTVWQYDAKSAITASPSVSNKKVVFATLDGKIHTLDSLSGKKQWIFANTDHHEKKPVYIDFNSRPLIDDGVIFIGSRDTNLYALDLETGELIWKFAYQNSWVESAASVFGDQLFLGSSFKQAQLAFNKHTGKLLWQANVAKGLSFAQLLVNDLAVYAGIMGDKKLVREGFLSDGGLLKLNSQNGEKQWFFPLPKSVKQNEFGLLSAPLLSTPTSSSQTDKNNIIFLGGLDGNFYALSDTRTAHNIVEFKASRAKIKAGYPTEISWMLADNSRGTLNGQVVDNIGTQSVTLEKSTEFTLKTTGDNSEQQTLEVQVLPAEEINIAAYATVKASSVENASPKLLPSFVNDENSETRWASDWSDEQWLLVDLGTAHTVQRMVLNWEPAHAKEYEILLSDDNKNWRSVYQEQNGQPGYKEIEQINFSGRFLKLDLKKRATEYGYSLYELEIYAN